MNAQEKLENLQHACRALPSKEAMAILRATARAREAMACSRTERIGAQGLILLLELADRIKAELLKP